MSAENSVGERIENGDRIRNRCNIKKSNVDGVLFLLLCGGGGLWGVFFFLGVLKYDFLKKSNVDAFNVYLCETPS